MTPSRSSCCWAEPVTKRRCVTSAGSCPNVASAVTQRPTYSRFQAW